MIELKDFILPEQDQDQETTTVGTVSEIIKEFKAVNVVKSKFALILDNKDGQKMALTISRPVDEALKAGEITPAQLGNLVVLKGKNKDKQDRLYIVMGAEGQLAATDFLEAAAKAEPVRVGSFGDLKSA